jgi:hypothetical protein
MEEKREELYQLLNISDLKTREVIKCSQELDILINELYQLSELKTNEECR